jgi:hypothetical protein
MSMVMVVIFFKIFHLKFENEPASSSFEVLNSKKPVPCVHPSTTGFFVVTKHHHHHHQHRHHKMTTMETMMRTMTTVRSPSSRPRLLQKQQLRWQHLFLFIVLLLPCLCWSMPTYILEIPSQKCIEVEGPVDSTIHIAYFIPGTSAFGCCVYRGVLALLLPIRCLCLPCSLVCDVCCCWWSCPVSLSLLTSLLTLTLFCCCCCCYFRFKSRRKGRTLYWSSPIYAPYCAEQSRDGYQTSRRTSSLSAPTHFTIAQGDHGYD